MLTGATGYVGGRLLSRLRARGARVRCLTRRPDELRARVADDVEVVGADLLDPSTLDAALAGVDVAYYLVHSMAGGEGFREREARAARNFGAAAADAGLDRIIYLGGLGDENGELSEHLESRHEVGRILRSSGVPATEFRASIIIGSGSLSFEMIRALVDRLPIMVWPRWVRTPAQPISIEDVLDYLTEELGRAGRDGRVVEVGGADVVSYGEIMKEYARQRSLRRVAIPVPVLTPRLSSLWLGLVTPVFARIGRALIAGVRHPTVVRDPGPASAYDVAPRTMREAIERALVNEDREFALTRWSDARSSGERTRSYGGRRVGSRYVDARTTTVDATPGRTFACVERIGGETGWYYADGLWSLRGLLDLFAGGVGVRRGRRDPARLLPGDAVDFWRVEDVDRPRLLRLRAEMRVPGRAWLQFEVDPAGDGARLTQTALFDAAGLFGRTYWYVLWPIHQLVFAGMLKGIRRRAETGDAG